MITRGSRTLHLERIRSGPAQPTAFASRAVARRRTGWTLRRWSVVAFAAAAWAVVTAAPSAAAASREQQQIMADLRMLQEQNQQLQLALAQLAETLRAVNGRLDQQSDASRRGFADQKLLVDTLTGDVRTLREKLDDTNVRISSLGQEVEALRTSMPPPPAFVEPTPADAAAATPPEGAPPPPAVPAVNPAAGLSPQRLWDQAYADYTAGQWALAIAGFETFIKTFPRHERADSAQYYVGESYLLDGRFDQAIAAYDRVIANFPSGDQVPFAFYKRGLAQARLGQTDRARESWETVIAKYPASDAAVMAKQGLDRLARPGR
jgi:tol-pal system protein YbgF